MRTYLDEVLRLGQLQLRLQQGCELGRAVLGGGQAQHAARGGPPPAYDRSGGGGGSGYDDRGGGFGSRYDSRGGYR